MKGNECWFYTGEKRRRPFFSPTFEGFGQTYLNWTTLVLSWASKIEEKRNIRNLFFSEPRSDGDVVDNLHHFFTVQLPLEARTRENKLRSKIENSGLELGAGVLAPPRDLLAEDMAAKGQHGELGRPVTLPPNITADVKKLVDEGWSKNAFNQYVSDLISVHRSLPDPRDQW